MGERKEFLLDTHVLLWALGDRRRLSPAADEAIRRTTHRLWVSSASVWEIATKSRIGKLPQGGALLESLPGHLKRLRAQEMPIRHVHAMVAGALASEHRDPFDRILAAQSDVEAIALITADPAFVSLGTVTVW